MMKFNVGEEVKIVAKDVVGKVVQTEYKKTVRNTGTVVEKRYFVKYEGTYGEAQVWVDEDGLRSADNLKKMAEDVINKSLRGSKQQMIDHYLEKRDFEMVKKLQEEN